MKTPRLAVDLIIQIGEEIVLIRRKNPPYGWALPGGFVEYGEALEAAAVREALEETSLRVTLQRQLHAYSEPDRDPRGHTVSVVYVATAVGVPRGADDAREARTFRRETLPEDLAFDHRDILEDFWTHKDGFL